MPPTYSGPEARKFSKAAAEKEQRKLEAARNKASKNKQRGVSTPKK
jgi:hypothetical protein